MATQSTPTFPSALPNWAKDWVDQLESNPDQADLADATIDLCGGRSDVVLLFGDPAIAQGLADVTLDLTEIGELWLDYAMRSFIARACWVKWDAGQRLFRSPSQTSKDVRDTACAARALAKHLRTNESLFRGATTLAYLIEKSKAPDVPNFFQERSGPRFIEYTRQVVDGQFVASPTIDELLDLLASDLDQQLEFDNASSPNRVRRKTGGPSASKNYQIDSMIEASELHLREVYPTLIATILSTINTFEVTESTVRKRARRRPI